MEIHGKAVSDVVDQTTETIARLTKESQASIVAYQQQKEEAVTATLAEREVEIADDVRIAIIDLTAKVAKKEPELVSAILKEVTRPYGSL